METNIIESLNVSVDSFSFKSNPDVKGKSFSLNPELNRAISIGGPVASDPSLKEAFIKFSVAIHSSEQSPSPFELSAAVVGSFKVSAQMKTEDVNQFLLTNGSRIVFPFLRSLVTSLTGDAQIVPLYLPLVFWPDDEASDVSK